MIYKFKSKAAGDVIMLEPNGRRVLQIIGKDSGAKGIILPEQMPAAIAALESAIADEERQDGTSASQSTGETADPVSPVSLRQRAVPFIDMLKRCSSAGHEIVWGV